MKILMLPWLAHGHMSPFLELAKRLAKKNFHIYLCSTSVNLSSIKNQIAGKYSDSIEPVELQLPCLPDLPPHYHTTNGLPPHLMTTLKTAYEMSAPNFSNILTTLHPDLVMYDFNQPWAAEIASSQNIPAVQFLPFGASMTAFGLYMIKYPGKELPYPEIYIRDYEIAKVRSRDARVNDVSDGQRFLQGLDLSCKILLVKSFKEIEERFMDFLSVASGKKVVPVGPLVQDISLDDIQDEEMEIINWLDQKENASVVFVSFGSEYFLTEDERSEIARGLELSNVNFIWVIRFPFGGKITVEKALPEGFLERVGDRGKIVDGWAPQARILKHANTGAFLSHCGWSSMMESMKFGVPMIALPMNIDQPLNARLIEAVGVGLEPLRDEKGNLQSEEIAKVIRKVLVEESGKNVRRKAKELSEQMEMRGDEEEIDNLVEEVVQLCQKNNGCC
ncbi:UDP-glucosyltransferase 29 [Coffea arabica]|nr:beta-D-glucosyl crocetin beta-1,6-glucosyltransferase-like [Coffea arabica]